MRKDRQTVEMLIDMESQEKMTEIATQYDMTMDFCEGGLQDNIIIYDYEGILKIGRYKPRKYYITVAKYLNEWSSCLRLIMTDSDKIVQEYEELFQSWRDERQEENRIYEESLSR